MENNLNFKGGNPGAVTHGNFINYYQFHPTENRMKILPDNIWHTQENGSDYLALDIGCNAGDLTIELHNYLKTKIKSEVHTLGIDIDPTLIKRAEDKCTQIDFKCLDFMNLLDRELIINSYLKEKNKSKFNMIFCFSTTMWIHLNNGDEGLRNFLKDLCKLTDNILIEPQPWKCYKSAEKRMKISNQKFPLFKSIKITNTEYEINKIILQSGFMKTTETIRTDWGRKFFIYNINK